MSEIKLTKERKYRLMLAVDETKLEVEGQEVNMWTAVDADKDLLALDASYRRSSLNAYLFLRKALRMCEDKPMVLVDGGPRYPCALQRLGLQYIREGFGVRSAVRGSLGALKKVLWCSITN